MSLPPGPRKYQPVSAPSQTGRGSQSYPRSGPTPPTGGFRPGQIAIQDSGETAGVVPVRQTVYVQQALASANYQQQTGGPPPPPHDLSQPPPGTATHVPRQPTPGHTPPHAGAHSSHHMMYSQQQVSHQNTQPPRAPAGSGPYPRQNIPHQTRPVLNITSSPGSMMNQTLQPMFVSQHSQHPSQFVPQGAQVITMQGPQIGYPSNQRMQTPQFIAPSPSGFAAAVPTGSTYYPPTQQSANPVCYYPTQNTGTTIQNQPIPRPVSQPQATPSQPQTSKRERKPLLITDPSTGRNVLADMQQDGSKGNTPPLSESSSSKDTPITENVNVESSHSVGAQFAEMVARTLKPETAGAAVHTSAGSQNQVAALQVVLPPPAPASTQQTNPTRQGPQATTSIQTNAQVPVQSVHRPQSIPTQMITGPRPIAPRMVQPVAYYVQPAQSMSPASQNSVTQPAVQQSQQPPQQAQQLTQPPQQPQQVIQPPQVLQQTQPTSQPSQQPIQAIQPPQQPSQGQHQFQQNQQPNHPPQHLPNQIPQPAAQQTQQVFQPQQEPRQQLPKPPQSHLTQTTVSNKVNIVSSIAQPTTNLTASESPVVAQEDESEKKVIEPDVCQTVDETIVNEAEDKTVEKDPLKSKIETTPEPMASTESTDTEVVNPVEANLNLPDSSKKDDTPVEGNKEVEEPTPMRKKAPETEPVPDVNEDQDEGKRNKRPANAQNQEKEIVSPEPEENGNTADEAVNDQKIQEPIKPIPKKVEKRQLKGADFTPRYVKSPNPEPVAVVTKEESNNVESKPPLPPSSNPAETSKQLLDKETNSEPISEEIPNDVPKNTVLNETSKEETTKVKTTVSEQDDSVLEDKMVAERNEKNEAQQRQIKSEEPAKEKMSVEGEESESVLAKEKKELKYNYGEDQWSPINPQGKKQYDRQFLLRMQYSAECLEKPADLPWLPDVILNEPISNKGDNRRQIPNFGDFTPGYVMPNAKGQMPINRRGSAQKGGIRPGPGMPAGPHQKVINIQIQQDIQLHTVENAWKPGHKDDKPAADENMAGTEDLYKKVKSILNKLTPQKFDKLSQQIMDLPINTEERIKGIIDIIFEKAISEPSFSKAYAQLCKLMISMKVPQDANKSESVVFRVLLLNRCQTEFEKDKAVELELAQKQKELDQAPQEQKAALKEDMQMKEFKAKRRSLGNIRFIGELFKLKMLTENIMHSCLFKLLKSSDEDNLESLCRLLTTIGKDIDNDKAKSRVDQYFNQMEKIVRQKRTCARVRFMIQDVIEVRKNRWVPRREDNAPKTIEEIHKEAQEESVQKQIMLQRVTVDQKRGGRGSVPPSGHRSGGQPDDWQQAITKSNRNLMDPSRMKLTKPVAVDDNIQLGPGGRGGFTGWGRGSSGGSGSGSGTSTAAMRSSSQEQERSTPNRFSVLSGGGAESYDARGKQGSGANYRGPPPPRDSGGNKGRLQPPNHGRGRNMARLSQEQDREAVLSAARNITGQRTPGGSRNQSRESSRNRETPREDVVQKPAEALKELNVDILEKKTIAFMGEYLHINDIKEAILCVKELESPSNIHMMVYFSINHVLERSNQARKMTGELHRQLVKENVITLDHYMKGMKEVLEIAEDMEIDIPRIWEYLAEAIAPLVGGEIPLNFVRTLCNPLKGSRKTGKLVAHILNEAVAKHGRNKVGELWRSSDLSWKEFLSTSENVEEFISSNKLDFTISEGPKSPDAKTLSFDNIQLELEALLVSRRVSNEEVFDWIERNVDEGRTKHPKFVRVLMWAVCTSAIYTRGEKMFKVSEEDIKKRVPILQRYLDHQAELELQALYALQELVHGLEHPSDVLRTFFDSLYDEDLISEDAFTQWECSNDPAEQAGLGVAKSSVVQFFNWLREAEEESQEDS